MKNFQGNFWRKKNVLKSAKLAFSVNLSFSKGAQSIKTFCCGNPYNDVIS
jgi:hypothetical protein